MIDFEKIKKYQARDNTKMNNIPEPKLKNKEVSKFVDNKTYLSQSPSKEISDINNSNYLLQKIKKFGEDLKQVGGELRDYAAVSTAILNPVAGMILGLGDAGISAIKGDYTNSGIQIGLEMLPYVGKTISNTIKAVNPVVKGFKKEVQNKLEDIAYKTAPRTKIGEKFILGQQDKAFKKGIDEIIKMWNGSSNLSNYNLYKTPSGIDKVKYNLDKNISKRIDISGLKINDKSIYTDINEENLDRFILFDSKNKNNFQYKGNSNIDIVKHNFKENNFDGYFDSNYAYNDIAVRRRDNSQKLRSPKDIRKNANHEATHLLQRNYKISLDVNDPITDYGIINQETNVGSKLNNFLNKSNYWSASGDELQSDLWAFRRLHNIGTKDLTDKEAKQFILENKRHFISKMDPNNNILIEGIKIIPGILPGFLGIKSLINKNNESE